MGVKSLSEAKLEGFPPCSPPVAAQNHCEERRVALVLPAGGSLGPSKISDSLIKITILGSWDPPKEEAGVRGVAFR